MFPELRILRECDTDAFWALRLEGLKQEPRSFGQSAEEHLAMPKEAFATRLRTSSAERDFVLGALAGAELIGSAGFYRLPNQKEFHRGHIWGVYVSSAYRGRGVGRRLMAELLRIAGVQPGLELINLAVASHNIPAKRLYESLGFELCGRDIRALKIGDTYVDEDLMLLRL
jgi:ribosomal protein S18 acetylase RimI-like enzyme